MRVIRMPLSDKACSFGSVIRSDGYPVHLTKAQWICRQTYVKDRRAQLWPIPKPVSFHRSIRQRPCHTSKRNDRALAIPGYADRVPPPTSAHDFRGGDLTAGLAKPICLKAIASAFCPWKVRPMIRNPARPSQSSSDDSVATSSTQHSTDPAADSLTQLDRLSELIDQQVKHTKPPHPEASSAEHTDEEALQAYLNQFMERMTGKKAETPHNLASTTPLPASAPVQSPAETTSPREPSRLASVFPAVPSSVSVA